MTPERRAWIDRWCSGWEKVIQSQKPDSEHYYSLMPLDVAIGYVRELEKELDNDRN